MNSNRSINKLFHSLKLHKMNGPEYSVLQHLNQHVDNFDDFADAVAPSGGNGAAAPALIPQKGQPQFTAQFALLSIQLAFTCVITDTDIGAFTRINFNALQAGTDTQSIFAFFSVNDYKSGYAKVRGQLPLSGGWVYNAPFVYGKDVPMVTIGGVNIMLDAIAVAPLRIGDVVFPITNTTGVNQVILSVHRCSQVEYATLLEASMSNSFLQKGIRFNLNDTSNNGLLQFTQPLVNFEKSWLGKYSTDSTDINSNKKPENFQNGIIDVPLVMGISKSAGICSYVNLSGYGAVNNITINLSTFANNVSNPQK